MLIFSILLSALALDLTSALAIKVVNGEATELDTATSDVPNLKAREAKAKREALLQSFLPF